MSKEDYKEHLAHLKVEKSEVQLIVMTGDSLSLKGVVNVMVQKLDDKRLFPLKLVIVRSKRKFTPLLGRDWMDVLYPK